MYNHQPDNMEAHLVGHLVVKLWASRLLEAARLPGELEVALIVLVLYQTPEWILHG